MPAPKLSVAAARTPASIGQRVCVQGWIRTRRDSKGGFSFLDVNDGSSLHGLQVIAEAAKRGTRETRASPQFIAEF